VLTFGGAYSVLSYVAQQAVEKYGWLQPGEMLDGLGMAETTPGPLIMVVQFVGFMGAYRNCGSLDPLVAGVLGSILTTWVTFVPCFLWILLGAPYIERLRKNSLLRSAMTAITAAVVGAVLNLALWFSVHTLFGDVQLWTGWGLQVLIPNVQSIRLSACGIAVLALLLTFYWRRGLATTLLASVSVGLIVYALQ
jgi:chromate transporter